ncbi:MAG TPA: hypothetical protein VNZ03_28050 [Terriglobales bacterium]|jgi:hypothetical protein|nr:hypothetical protein [Terriglobales bacterium]
MKSRPSPQRAMLRLLAILAISLSACAAGQEQHTKDEIHLRATVQAVVPLTSFSGQVTPVDVDPRFALTVHVESAIPALADFTEGSVVALAIHSPSRLFEGEPTNGKTYDFVLHRNMENGKVRFVGLTCTAVGQDARRVPAVDVSAPNRALGRNAADVQRRLPQHPHVRRKRGLEGTLEEWEICAEFWFRS